MLRLLLLTSFLSLCEVSMAQSKPKTPVKKTLSELNSLLTTSALPYKMVNDTLAVIPYGGANIDSYNVVVQKISDLYIIYTSLSEALPGKIDETKYKYLLEQNNHFDIVKIGMSGDDNNVFVRADVYKTGITATLLTRIIIQVANVSNIVAGDLK